MGWYCLCCLIWGIQEVAHWANWEWHTTAAAELGFLLRNLQLKHTEVPLAAHPLPFSPSLSQDLCYPGALVTKPQSCNNFSLIAGPNWYFWGHSLENWHPLKDTLLSQHTHSSVPQQLCSHAPGEAFPTQGKWVWIYSQAKLTLESKRIYPKGGFTESQTQCKNHFHILTALPWISVMSHTQICGLRVLQCLASVMKVAFLLHPLQTHTQFQANASNSSFSFSFAFLRRTWFFFMRNALKSTANSKHNNHWLGINHISIKPWHF